MATLTKPQAIEIFHLAFLQVLPQHLPPLNYAVKGGANLRLFLGSVRRSEDIDFNFVGHVPWSLQPRIDAALKSPATRPPTRHPRHQDRIGQPIEDDFNDRALEVPTRGASGAVQLEARVLDAARGPASV